MKEVYAEWLIKELPPEPLSDFHISRGAGGAQYDGYFPDDKGARLLIEPRPNGYRVTLTAPSLGLEKEKGYWLSPSLPDDETEAARFGIRERQKTPDAKALAALVAACDDLIGLAETFDDEDVLKRAAKAQKALSKF